MPEPTVTDISTLPRTQDLLSALLPEHGHKLALIHDGRQITYRELHADVVRLARGLASRLGRGELLALWLPNSPELLLIYLACFKSGVVPLPLHEGMKWPEVRAILDHSKARRFITSKTVAEPHAADLARSSLDRIYAIDSEPAPYRSYLELMDEGGDAVELSPKSLALVLHTSGSDGRAKGVMLSHENIGHILQYRLAHTRLTQDSVSVVASCLTQSVGFYQGLALLAAGGTIVLLNSYDIDRMADCVNRHQPTHLILVVEAFDRLLYHPGISEQSFCRLTFASTGADRVTARVQQRFHQLTGRLLRVSYGLTESSWPLVNTGERADKCLALGKPCPGIEVRLLGSGGREVPVGEVGEICIHSPRTMLGYLHDEPLTRAAFVDGWLRSGDLAYRDADGYYWFAGRKKHIIVLGSGDSVSPVEVENALLGHPAVSDCVVVGVPTPEGSETPWALVVRRDGTLTDAALDAFLRPRISDYKVPRRIVFVADLPVGATGKLDRDKARKLVDACAAEPRPSRSQ